MRLYAGVLPPPSVAGELGRAVDALRDLPGHDALRWTGRPGWHLTLAFYGEVPDGAVPELTRRLARAAHRTEPFALSLAGSGTFGGRTLWAGLRGDTPTLRLLADRAEAAARRAGLATGEHRRHRPHLTLARTRDTGPTVDLGPYAEALADFVGARWTVEELALVRSNLPTGGVPGARPRYETVAALPLRPAG
ncbi:RNA 2',3'-cyclic phosphodiesterase [Streptomyces sp. LE64]|uniref:RNA 2',3'-cyclic phosphodiesterase n=1 Tax=Streptomyces sp. LE64 TaxID=3448653 RepID=UPI004041665A